MGVNIKFDSWNGEGRVIPQFDAAKKINKAPNQFNENVIASQEKMQQRIEQELKTKVLHIDAFFETLDTDLIFDADLLSDKHFKEGGAKLKAITDKWDEVLDRYEKGNERTEALSKDLDQCDQMLKHFLAEMDEWKKKAKERMEFLEKNKEWKDQFTKAAKTIEEFSGTKEDFEKKHGEHGGKKAVDEDFDFDIRPTLLEHATKADQEIKDFDDSEWESWRKLYGAAKMVNSNLPKTIVVFEGKSLGVDAVKTKKVNEKEALKNAKESLNAVVSEKLHVKFDSEGVRDLLGNPFKAKGANLRYLSFVIAKDIIENDDNLELVMKEGIDSPSLNAEKKKIDDLIENIFNAIDNEEINDLVLKVYVYNVIGQFLATDSKFANFSPEEKNVKQRELVENGVFDENKEEFEDELAEFFELREEPGSKCVAFDKAEREKLNAAIRKHVEDALIVNEEPDADDSTVKAGVAAANSVVSGGEEALPGKDSSDAEKPKKKAEAEKGIKETEKEKEKTPQELYEEAGPNVRIVFEDGLKNQYDLYLDAVSKGEFSSQEADKYLQEDIHDILASLSTRKDIDKMVDYVFNLIKNSVK